MGQLAITFILLFSSMGHAWSNHYLVTQGALCALGESANVAIPVTSFSALIKDLGKSTPVEFNKDLKIHTRYTFEFKLNEREGQAVSAFDVLGIYSDEPDWGMDQDIYETDQYPELWKDEYGFMGGRRGFSSQGPRHMYYPEWSVSAPVASLKLPANKIFQPSGAAPERAQVFYELSQAALAAGHPYWAVRFLANALHYVEDVTQPYHAVQTPSKSYVVMPFYKAEGRGFKNYVIQVQNIVSYYHFAFEDFIGRLMKDGRKDFYLALSSIRAESSQTERLDLMVIRHAKLAMKRGAEAASLSFVNFPKIKDPYDTFDPKVFMDATWWERVLSQANSSTMNQYYALVSDLFKTLGASIQISVNQSAGLHSAVRTFAPVPSMYQKICQ
ncbi:MAG: hypothetical protein IT289_09640 [Oligoflexia bacterium]|nr:hypothetical protein [Oligoflexia bacterium]